MPRRQASPSPALELARASRTSGGVSSRTSTVTAASSAAALESSPAVDFSPVPSRSDVSDGAGSSSLRSLALGMSHDKVSVSDFDTVIQSEVLHSVVDVSSGGRSKRPYVSVTVSSSPPTAVPTPCSASLSSPVTSVGYPSSAAAFSAWPTAPPPYLGHGFTRSVGPRGYSPSAWSMPCMPYMPSVFQPPVPPTYPWSAVPRSGYPPAASSAQPSWDPWGYAGSAGGGLAGPSLRQQPPPPPPPLPPRSQPSPMASLSPEVDVSRLSGVSGGNDGGESLSYLDDMSMPLSPGRVAGDVFSASALMDVLQRFSTAVESGGPEPTSLSLAERALGVAVKSVPPGDSIKESPLVGQVMQDVNTYLASSKWGSSASDSHSDGHFLPAPLAVGKFIPAATSSLLSSRLRWSVSSVPATTTPFDPVEQSLLG